MKFRSRTPRRSVLLTLVLPALLYTALVMLLTFWHDQNRIADLSRDAWVLPLARSQVHDGEWERLIVKGECRPPAQGPCGAWQRLKSLNFAKDLGKTYSGALLLTSFSGVELPGEPKGPGRSPFPLILNFGDSDARITGWLNGVPLGETSRHLPPEKKFLPFAMVESLAIPEAALCNVHDAPCTNSVLLRIEELQAPHLPERMILNSLAVTEKESFSRSEMNKHLAVGAAIFLVIVMGLYHLGVWWRRQDNVYAVYCAFALMTALQALFKHNLALHFGVGEEFIWRFRAVSIAFNPSFHWFFAVFAGRPISYVWQKLRTPKARTAFDGFSRLEKVHTVAYEGFLLVLWPAILVLNAFLPFPIMTALFFKVCLPLVMVSSIWIIIVIAQWGFAEAKKSNIDHALPFFIGMSLIAAGVTTAAGAAVGSRFFSPLAATFAFSMNIFCFALSLGDQFTLVYRRLGVLKARLETILLGTRELATIHETLSAARRAARYVLKQMERLQQADVTLFLLDPKKGDTKVDGPVEPHQFLGARLITQGKDGEETAFSTSPESLAGTVDFLRAGTIHKSRREIFVPIKLGTSWLGFLVFSGDVPEALDDDDAHYIDALASSLAISLENISVLSDVREKALLQSELKAAKAVQESLLPAPIQTSEMELVMSYEAAEQTGGDWLGYYYDEKTHSLDLYIGDVTGHGVPSALLTGVAFGSVYSGKHAFQVASALAALTPEERLRHVAHIVNDVVRLAGRGQLLMTMAFLSVDLTTGKVLFLNAAHNAPLWLQGEQGEAKILTNAGSRLGFATQPKFSIKAFQLNPGDSVFLFTDGLIENTGPNQGDVLSERQLKKLLLQKWPTLAELQKTILDKAHDLWKGKSLADDVTTLAFRWKGAVSRESLRGLAGVPGASFPDAIEKETRPTECTPSPAQTA